MATILLVEDIPANLALARKLLCAARHDVLTAETAETGLDLARARRPDLVLMDLGLPGMTGWRPWPSSARTPRPPTCGSSPSRRMPWSAIRTRPRGGLRRLPQQADRLRHLLSKR